MPFISPQDIQPAVLAGVIAEASEADVMRVALIVKHAQSQHTSCRRSAWIDGEIGQIQTLEKFIEERFTENSQLT